MITPWRFPLMFTAITVVLACIGLGLWLVFTGRLWWALLLCVGMAVGVVAVVRPS